MLSMIGTVSDVGYRANPRTSSSELLERMEHEWATARGRVMAWAAEPRLVREGGPVTHAGPGTLRAAKALALVHVGGRVGEEAAARGVGR